MPLLHHLAPGDPFPPTSEALSYPNGLLAVSRDLTTERLLAAYTRGIFPWFEDPQPVLWWTPNPRSVLFTDAFHISRSLRRTLRRDRFLLSVDQHFTAVMAACADSRRGQSGTWINRRMVQAYTELHHAGFAHSIEVSDHDGRLAGGLYGVALGGAFFGESMFSRQADASKVALAALVQLARQHGINFIDCQVESDHLNSLGARNLDRLDFERLLEQTVSMNPSKEAWHLPASCGELV